MAVGRSSSGSERTYCANSLAWAYLRFKGQGFITLRSEYRTLLLRRLREEDPSGDQLDSSYDRFYQELGKMRAEYVIIAHQLVVTQLSRNPIRVVDMSPPNDLQMH